MMVDGVEYGEVRQYGNFSFTRVYEAGHEVPYYQRMSPRHDLCQHVLTSAAEASLELFRRNLLGLDMATGKLKISGNYSTSGQANATHTAASAALPSVTGSAQH